MSPTSEQLLSDVLALPEGERLEFVEALLASFRPDDGPPFDESWREVIEREYNEFCEWIDAGEDTLLDPYGAQSVDEFFAVASEVFFVAPADLRVEHPALYELLAGYYRQDPGT